MKKIVLISAKGASAEMVVDKMREVAKNQDLDCEIFSVSLTDLNELKKINPDLVFFMPPRFRDVKKVEKICPTALIDMIGMKDYAFMNGESILKIARKRLEF